MNLEMPRISRERIVFGATALGIGASVLISERRKMRKLKEIIVFHHDDRLTSINEDGDFDRIPEERLNHI